ncbi:MAG: hypothetical protein N2Z60_00725 [Elusimicrobiales bacterium]|nr:hypothetical protein [Elusimicrobiales bacterium]HOJ86038.1 hypothetical protein [Elusimicrobiales bacterium]HOL62245.1 hypothetical protein [Elusimicrobiales bacterium]HPO95423.1 hypothetical protein [Elusimicrobiales bacterium]
MDEKKISFKTKALISFLILIAISSALIYFSKNSIKNFLEKKILEEVSKKLNRKITYSDIDYSLNGAKIKDLAIYEKDGSNIFAKAKEIDLKMDFKKLIKEKKDFEIERLSVENAEINLIKSEEWNFKDITDLFSDTSKNLSETYFIKETVFTNSDLLIKNSKSEYLFKNSDFKITHAKNSETFNISLKTDSYINLGSARIFFKASASFISEIKDRINKIDLSEFSLSEITYENLKAEKITSRFYIDSLSKEIKIETNINSVYGIKELEFFKKANEAYRKIYSKDINLTEPKNLNLKFIRLGKIISLDLESDDFSVSSKIDLSNLTHLFVFKSSKVYLETKSGLKNPVIKSNLSESINREIRETVIRYEETVLKFAENFDK